VPSALAMGIDYRLDLGMRSEVARSDERVGIALVGYAASSKLSWCQEMRACPEISFGMSLLTTPLLNAWPSQACVPQFDLYLKVVLFVTRYPLDRHLPLWVPRHDLDDQHTPLVTDWALAQRRAGEFFIALPVILDGFDGRWLELRHAQQFSAVYLICSR
jgi:hypothetical protein